MLWAFAGLQPEGTWTELCQDMGTWWAHCFQPNHDFSTICTIVHQLSSQNIFQKSISRTSIMSTLRRQRHVHVEKAHALCSGTSTVIPPETAAKEECWAKTLSSQSCLVHEQTSAQIVPTLHHTKPTYTMSWRDLGSTHTTLSRVR